jgi:phosphoenolpyruvate synthase/pyruvate phosphate dikinase
MKGTTFREMSSKMRQQDIILWFRDLRKEDIPLVGGKCANLGEVAGKLGILVPDGFVVTAYTYKVFLKKTGAVCKKHGVTTSICGQAPSVYPDYLEFMIRCGCTSISVIPDTVGSARRSIAMTEQKILMEKALGMLCNPKIAKIPMEDIFFWRHVED